MLEMDREPKNAQVVTQGTSENSVIFLVDENGLFLIYRPDHTDQTRPLILKYRPTRPDHAHAPTTCADHAACQTKE